MSFGVLHGLISSIATSNVRNPVAAVRSDGVTPEAPPELARTSVTPVTPLIVEAGMKGVRLYRLTPKQAAECHVGGWDDAEISTFVRRHARLLALGFGDGDADDLAERLTLRDRDGDDRRMCVECTWLGDTIRCLAAATGRKPGADRRFQPVQTILQRCGAFGLRKGQV